MTETESVEQAGRFTGRDLSGPRAGEQCSSQRYLLQASQDLLRGYLPTTPIPLVQCEGLARPYLQNPYNGDLPMLGLLGAVFIALLPFLRFSET